MRWPLTRNRRRDEAPEDKPKEDAWSLFRFVLTLAILAWALRSYGVPIKAFIEKRLGLIAGVAALALIVLYFAARMLAGSGMLTAC